MRNILILASAAALAAISVPASASDTTSRAVGYGDLNLGNQAGVSALKQRVRSAASSVCSANTAQDLASTSRVRACINDAMSDAEKAVDRAIRTAHAS